MLKNVLYDRGVGMKLLNLIVKEIVEVIILFVFFVSCFMFLASF